MPERIPGRQTLNGHKFNALVFPVHTECPNYELGDSREIAAKGDTSRFRKAERSKFANRDSTPYPPRL
jgi:hypothetical protein